MSRSNVLDWDNDTGTANMYGCQACPQCKSVYRFATQDDVIHCDDCGHAESAEPARSGEEPAQENNPQPQPRGEHHE